MLRSPFKHLAIERKLAFGLLLVAGLMSAAVIASWMIKLSADRVEELGLDSVARSMELDRALYSIVDAENRQRGYLLTGDEALLQPYEGARVRAASAFTNLRYQYADNGEMLTEIEALASVVQQRLDALQAPLEVRRTGGEAAMRARLQADHDRAVMDRIQSTLGKLKARESELYADLARALDERRTRLLYAELSVLALMLAAGAAAWRSLLAQARERQQLAEQLAQQALHDALTGLPNRRQFADELARSIARAARRQEQRCILFIDLDDFKRVNDELGHHEGDQALQEVARRFARVARRGDFVARLGGDEFAVLLEEPSPEAGRRLAQRLVDSLAEPLLPAYPGYRVGASIGVAVFPDDADEPEALLNQADAAMYEAKRARKGRVQAAASAA